MPAAELSVGAVSCAGFALVGVGVALAVAVPLAGDVAATVVVGTASVASGASDVDVLRGKGFGEVWIVALVGAVAGPLGGDSVVVTGVLITVEVMVGGWVGGGDVTSDGFVSGTTAGASDDCGGGISGVLAGFGVRPAGLEGLTGVVVGPVAGSANAGVIPPLSAVNEIAVPVASAITNPRPR